jgi:hypothetical protein
MPIDQARLDLARAVGLLRLQDRLAQSATAAQKAALAKEISDINQKAPVEFKQAQEMLKFENSQDAKGKAIKPPTAPKSKAWDAEVAAKKKKIAMGARKPTKPVAMTMTASDLESLLSGSKTSSFKKVYDALGAYEAEKNVDPEKAQELLQAVEFRAERWLNEHKKDKDELATGRRQMLTKLCEQASFEQARFSQGEAQKRYMANIANAHADDDDNPDPDVKFGFTGLTTESKDNVADNVLAPGGPQQRKYVPPAVGSPPGTKGTRVTTKIPNPHKLTIGEIAAIQTFTGPDYGTINPATANSKERLDENRAKNIGSAFEMQESDEVYMSEGVIHVGMAMSGLRKLPPYTAGPIYRGLSATQAQLTDWRTNGYVQVSLGSASTDRTTSEQFADYEQGADKPVAVLLVLNNAEGRDISHISVKPHENEVIILAGTKFAVNSSQQLLPPPRA